MPNIVFSAPITLDNAVLIVTGDPKPVIFWDTCAILDILRLPLPSRDFTVRILERITAIRDKLQSGEIYSFASHLSIKEINDNLPSVFTELEKAATRITKEHNKFIGFVNKVNPPGNTIGEIDLKTHALGDLLFDTIQSIIDQTYFIDREQEFADNAEFRVLNKIPPAHMKGEYKDAYILSTCIAFKRDCPGLISPFGFLSSNKNDFADETGTNFIDVIKNQTDPLGITYLPNHDLAFAFINF